MKKLRALFIIAIFVFSLFSIVSVTPNVNADNACCAKSGNSYCTFTDESNCDSGYQKASFACSQVDFCANVCMIDSSGICYQQVSKSKCEDLQKKDSSIRCLNQAECNVQQCVTGFCVIGGQCQSKVSATQCKLAAEKLKVPYNFDSSVTSESECRQKYSSQEGCCVNGNNCQRTTAKECSGDFKANMLCSNDQLAGVCQDYKKQDDKKCGPTGEDVYYIDSQGNYENVVGVLYDGFIHDKPDEIMNAVGNCDYSKGTVCGKDAKGEFSCIDINCNVGDEFIQTSYSPAKSEVEKESIKVTSDFLGEQNTRKNGESWCVLSDKLARISTDYREINDDENLLKTAYLNEKDAPGSRHYKFSCINGKIQVEPCGEFRDSICKSSIDQTKSGLSSNNFETALCIDNKWEKCTTCKSNWYSFVPWADWGDCKKSECEALGDCVYNTQDINECWPKYPPGFEFTELKISSAPQGQDPSLCSVCGVGAGQCDDNECYSMGDCSFKDTISVAEGVLIGGTIGFFTGMGAAWGVETIQSAALAKPVTAADVTLAQTNVDKAVVARFAGTATVDQANLANWYAGSPITSEMLAGAKSAVAAGGGHPGQKILVSLITKTSTAAKVKKGITYATWIPQTLNGVKKLWPGPDKKVSTAKPSTEQTQQKQIENKKPTTTPEKEIQPGINVPLPSDENKRV